MTGVAPSGELLPTFLRRGAVVTVVLLAIAGLAVVLTSRSDMRTARDLCAASARSQLGAPVAITEVDRAGDDALIVRGIGPARAFACLVTREPISDQWEVSSVS